MLIMKKITLAITLLAVTLATDTTVLAASATESPAAHHQHLQATQQSAESAKTAVDPSQNNMEKMQVLMVKIRETQDPAERQRLLAEHGKAMHEQMERMRPTGGMMDKHAAQTDGKDSMDKKMSSGDMMKMCTEMRARMDMMQRMMEQMMAHGEAEHAH
jgi:hypothetical protein